MNGSPIGANPHPVPPHSPVSVSLPGPEATCVDIEELRPPLLQGRWIEELPDKSRRSKQEVPTETEITHLATELATTIKNQRNRGHDSDASSPVALDCDDEQQYHPDECLIGVRSEHERDPDSTCDKISHDESTDMMERFARPQSMQNQASIQSPATSYIRQIQPVVVRNALATITISPVDVLAGNPFTISVPDTQSSDSSPWGWFIPSLPEITMRSAVSLLTTWCSGIIPVAMIGSCVGAGSSQCIEDAELSTFDARLEKSPKANTCVSDTHASCRHSAMLCHNPVLLSSDTSLPPSHIQDQADVGGGQQSSSKVKEANSSAGHKGGPTAERLAGVVSSAGQSTFQYLTCTVAPATVDFASKSVTVATTFLTSHVQAIPRFPDLFGGTHGAPSSRSASQGDLHDGRECTRNSAETSSPDGEPTGRSSRLCIPMPTNPVINNLQDKSKPKGSPGGRHRPLYSISSLEQLDPEIRRELEEKGFVSLGAKSAELHWWDPRRCGLPKYVLCSGFRRPRPCTLILLTILAMCITCKSFNCICRSSQCHLGS